MRVTPDGRHLAAVITAETHQTSRRGISSGATHQQSNPRIRASGIRVNTELVKKPRDLLEYVIVHEMAHLLEPTHNDRFVGILDLHSPGWREARADLNGLPLAAEIWRE